ncbi:hypothetical protein FB45DRAFT_1050978 [Roridomyces roridus]|uniref:F-box domain-containing protein n=1 Tax=Roridomyces roridus TaxID=1738132 RepID=A0AAD7FZK8_9AGAR|nr:hypothetical protein FB45DRAFT_1050978 [Roridomyces roridus]
MASDAFRRPHNSRVVITERLPTEVLAKIVEYAPSADKASLCRISKFFNELSLPILNRNVVLHMIRYKELKRFFRAIIAHPERANATRSLAFTNESSDLDFKSSFYDLLIESTSLMRKLEHFSVIDRSTAITRETSILTCLASLTFPRPREAPPKDCPEKYGEFDDPAHIGALLPNLQHYDGTVQFLPMLSSRCLAEARIPWILALEDIDSMLGTLKSLLDARLPNVVFLDFSYSFNSVAPRTLSVLPENIPHLSSLKICVRSMTALSQRNILNCFKECLPRFSSPKYIAFEYSDPTLSGDGDILTLQSWADICPTLKACSIGGKAWTKVDDGWEECSIEEFEIEAGFSVFESI